MCANASRSTPRSAISNTTTVSAGRLVLQGEASLSDDGTLNITGGQVEVATKERIGVLQLNDTPQLPGIWGSETSGAQYTDPRFVGDGLLYVGVGFPPSGTVIIVR